MTKTIDYKQQIEQFIITFMAELGLKGKEFYTHILFLILQDFFSNRKPQIAFMAFMEYDNLEDNSYKKLYEYTKIIDI